MIAQYKFIKKLNALIEINKYLMIDEKLEQDGTEIFDSDSHALGISVTSEIEKTIKELYLTL